MPVPLRLDIFSHNMDLELTEMLVCSIPLIAEVGMKWFADTIWLNLKASAESLEYDHPSTSC